MKVSVVIPTKNGGQLFKKVIEKILSQKTNFDFNIVVVDSGSKDGTVEFLESHKSNKIILLKIPPQDFGHGKTRNYAISQTDSEFIALLTQDALPYDDNWLQYLIDSFKEPEIVGVFGKHLPYENSFPVEKKTIIDHFDVSFGKEFLKVKLEDELDFEKRQGWYVYYSDNNSALRRSAWEKIPYPEVEMAEDQHWAKLILKAGFTKVYNPKAIVYHSHKYSFGEVVKRHFDEYKFHVKIGNAKRANLFDALKFYLRSYKYSFKTVLASNLNVFQKFYWVTFYKIYDLFRAYGYYIGTNYERFGDKYSMQEEIKNK